MQRVELKAGQSTTGMDTSFLQEKLLFSWRVYIFSFYLHQDPVSYFDKF